jgi:plasmid stabilization system protein ParE
MPKQIIWSPSSEEDFTDILEYLNQNWGAKVLQDFISILHLLTEQIAINPKQFPIIYKKKRIRKCVITKHNSIFYRESKDSVDILRIYDSRQDPVKLKFT